MDLTDEELEIAIKVAALLNIVQEEIASNLKAIRKKKIVLRPKESQKAKIMPQEMAAEKCDLSCRTFSRIENGLENCSLKTILGVCLGMNVSIYELIGEYVYYKEKIE